MLRGSGVQVDRSTIVSLLKILSFKNTLWFVCQVLDLPAGEGDRQLREKFVPRPPRLGGHEAGEGGDGDADRGGDPPQQARPGKLC